MESKFTEAYQEAPEEALTTNCERTAYMLDMIIDGEATPEDQQFFNSHIEECVSCFESHQKQKLLKGLVSGHLQRVIVPESLVHSIKVKIQETV